MAGRSPAREVRVAPNIYKGPYGWRVYLRRFGKLKPKRFKRDVTIEEVQHFVDTFKLESKKLRRERRKTKAAAADDLSFRKDAARYVELETVKAMPSYQTRQAEIEKWVDAFGDRIRRSITTREIDEQLQAFLNDGYSGSSVNKFRTALMAMWTRLDGRSAANPVRDAMMFDEAPLVARGQSYDLLTLILDSIPEQRGRGVKGKKGSRSLGSESRARLEVLAWTGMDPSQLGRMKPGEHVNVRERWYITPHRQKGSRRRRTPRPVIKKPMSAEAARAFQRLIALGLLGKKFSTHSLRHTWYRAIGRVERELREEYDDPDFTLPHIRLKDIRHSFGTRLFEQVAKAKRSEVAAREIVGLMLDHAPGSPMTLRYSLGAVPNVLRTHLRALPGRRKLKRRRA
jgi:integrase